MATRRNQAQWQKLIEQQARSGLSAAAFCRHEDIGYPSFMAWRNRLRVPERETIPQPVPERFIELTPALHESNEKFPGMPANATPTSSTFCVELSLGDGINLRISRS
ncbi:IS66 family insertion sequence element accessory protein TnpA [Granulosicoccus antarcticus]|uniref:Transposase n=1 Tax=Granulosicoccus antarcticus IMCC3135 TaxID=1192854 RepID=A0A2Z2NTI9_9GAMM|nr:hypothetical protein [Granulosicoccus antarcticus]ASJ74583.1 hypothetical protein IMCC3135_22565 [Granulosicoccus antarcticus IMCC3135]ASJ74623.1 hypothetical protein IMCC3135_22765 [Granulosicoccus antarcticus IMCC3135]